MVTRSPREVSSRPSDDAVSPLPREEATPPVTNTCVVGVLVGMVVTSRLRGSVGGSPEGRGPGGRDLSAELNWAPSPRTCSLTVFTRRPDLLRGVGTVGRRHVLAT